VTVYNEPVSQPGAPEHLDVEALLKGMYHYASPTLEGDRPRAQILVSGVTMTAALKAQQMLADEWGVAADVWSVTSWNELRRDAVETEHWNLTHPDQERRWPFVTRTPARSAGSGDRGQRLHAAVQDQIAPWVHHTWCSLGTDGFGSPTPARRRGVTSWSMLSRLWSRTLQSLARDGTYDASAPGEAFDRYRLGDPTAVAGVAQEGADA
jgi:pyruvate dehydrogenase E1 component